MNASLNKPIRIHYLYHSGFAIEVDDITLIIDYYKDASTQEFESLVNEYLLKRSGPLYVMSTHFHADHFTREIFSWREKKSNIFYILSNDIANRHRADINEATFLKKGEAFNDANIRIEAFGSTDCGVSFLIDIGGYRIFHAGDLNNWHWRDESTEQEVNKAEGDFLSEVRYITKSIKLLDIAFFPIDARMGSDYYRGAQQFVNLIKIRNFVPMHFGDDYESAEAFRYIAESFGCHFVSIKHRGELFEIVLNNQINK